MLKSLFIFFIQFHQLTTFHFNHLLPEVALQINQDFLGPTGSINLSEISNFHMLCDDACSLFFDMLLLYSDILPKEVIIQGYV
jgi:hypothetical protein